MGIKRRKVKENGDKPGGMKGSKSDGSEERVERGECVDRVERASRRRAVSLTVKAGAKATSDVGV